MVLRKGAAWPGLTGLVVLTLSLLIAAACAAPPQARKDLPPEETIVRSATAEQPVKSVKEDSTASVHDEKSSPAPKPEPTPKISRRVINNDPTQLIGLAPDAINRLLGPPSLLRTEPPAQVWQYKIADCVLDIFLYTRETEPEDATVIYFEIREGKAAPRGTRACFTAILESRMIQPVAAPKS